MPATLRLAGLVPAMKVVPPNVGKAQAICAFQELANIAEYFHFRCRNRMSFSDFSHAREAQRAPGLASLVPAMKVMPPNVGKAEAIRAFKEHADATNDVFHIAALVLARTILLASKLAAGNSTPGKSPRALDALIPAPMPFPL